MSKIFIKGNRITTNNRNCFEIIDINEIQIVCKNLLTDEFSIFFKTEHKFALADVRVILTNDLIEILADIKISDKDKSYVLEQMVVRINNYIIK